MTDKIQKIKDWISKTQDGLMDANGNFENPSNEGAFHILSNLDYYIDSLQEEFVIEELLDMTKIDYKIQYASIDDGIHAYAEDYSFNIESELFNQLTKEQQVLWRKEIEQAAISGGHCGVELARDKRYEENREPVSEELEKALAMEWQGYNDRGAATVDALEDNTQELAFAKGFYRGAKWQKEQMIAKAIDAYCFGFQGAALFSFRLPADNYLVGSEVKIIVIKED